MRATLKGINRTVRKYGVELVKGTGYYYVAPLMGEPPDHPANRATEQGLYGYGPYLNRHSAEDWVEGIEKLLQYTLEEMRDAPTWEEWKRARGIR